jgi:endonuclease
MPLYDKPVRLLMRDMVKDWGLTLAQTFDRERAIDWFKERYPLVKEGTISAHLIRLATNAPSRLHYRPGPDDDLLYQVAGSTFRLYDAAHDPAPITKESPPDLQRHQAIAETPGDDKEGSEFAYEHDLRDFLAKNLSLLEPGLQLYQEEGITGIEFPAGGRFIDILAVDRTGALVVVELKVSRGYDRTVGQLLRYIGWIEANQAEPGQRVRGVIVAKEISEDLLLACRRIQDVALYEYQLSVTLRRVSSSSAPLPDGA